MDIQMLQQYLDRNCFDDLFRKLYGNAENTLKYQNRRYRNALKNFAAKYPGRSDVCIFSAPGRTEIGGNHTDHQHGIVLAGAVNLDAVAIVSFHNEGVIRLKSKGYPELKIHLNDTAKHLGDSGTAAIIRGIANRYQENGIHIGGFDMYCVSDVISGSGISSSAAFEILLCTIIDHRYNNSSSSPLEIARIAWYAENEYFGKKCGLLDQTVSAVGGLVSIDFCDVRQPKIEKIEYDFQKSGYTLCITDTKSSHADLSDDYDAIHDDMAQVAAYFGCTTLNEVDKIRFYEKIPVLREYSSDRAVLRASHFFEETERAKQEADALQNGSIHDFLHLVNASGESSAALLQNLYSCKQPDKQAIPLALMMSKRILKGEGAVRVHGGGFAGTIQAFVPAHVSDEYVSEMERIFGKDSCHTMHIRPAGGIEITPNFQ